MIHIEHDTLNGIADLFYEPTLGVGHQTLHRIGHRVHQRRRSAVGNIKHSVFAVDDLEHKRVNKLQRLIHELERAVYHLGDLTECTLCLRIPDNLIDITPQLILSLTDPFNQRTAGFVFLRFLLDCMSHHHTEIIHRHIAVDVGIVEVSVGLTSLPFVFKRLQIRLLPAFVHDLLTIQKISHLGIQLDLFLSGP